MTSRAEVSRSAGFYLALLQFMMALCWTVYLIYLPQLASAVGIPRSMVIPLLMLDQAIFTVTDFALGVAADRTARMVGRLGPLVAKITAASCLAFLALPWIAAGHGGKAVFVTLAVVWAATSSALRAPPLMLLGKYAARPVIPWMASLALLGVGIAGALAPYLAVALRSLDPRWPFLLASSVLVLTSFGLAPIERRLAASAEVRPVTNMRLPRFSSRRLAAFALVGAALGLGFQIHFSIDSPRLFLHFTRPAALEMLMPVFWIGFNLAMFAAAPLVARWGGIVVMGMAGLCAGIFALIAALAGSLSLLVIMQFGIGAAWGVVVMSAISAALGIGTPGNEGRAVGMMYSALAVATFARMAMVAGGLDADPAYSALFGWTPTVAWAGGGVVLLALAGHRGKKRNSHA